MEDIVITEQKRKAYQIVLAGCSMLICSIAVGIYGWMDEVGIFLIIGIIGGIFFGIGTVVSFARAAKGKPLIVIKWDSIEDYSSASAVGKIMYGEIKSIQVVNIFGQRVIGIWPKDSDEFVKRLSKAKQRAAKMNMKMNFPPVSMRVDTAKDMTIEDIYTLLEKRLEDYKSLYN